MKNAILGLLTILVFTVSGCAMLEPLENKSADKVAELVEKYCEETDASFREGYRKKINDRLGTKSIKVECN